MASTAAKSKKTGKENAPPRGNIDVADDSFGEIDEVVVKANAKSTDRVAGKQALKTSKSRGGEDDSGFSLQRRVDQLTAECDRLKVQNEKIAKQMEELSSLRGTKTEDVLNKYKERAEIRATAQQNLITSLTESNDKIKMKYSELKKQLEADAPKPDPKEIKALKDELAKMTKDLSVKQKDYETLDKEYTAEKQFNKTLQANKGLSSSRSGAPPSESVTTGEDQLKDAAIIRLYEDIMDLSIVNVKIKEGKHGPKDKEYVYNCVYTVKGGRSIQFKLRSYNELDEKKLAKREKNPYDAKIDYIPELDHETDQIFLNGLGLFKEQFQLPRDQLEVMFINLKEKLAA